MTKKATNITGWILTGLIAFVFIGSAVMKMIGSEEAAKGAVALGLSATTLKLIGVVELISILLFIYPRTGLLGTLLLAAYLGGAIATHLEHGQPITAPVLIQCFVWITAAVRFPELTARFMGKALPATGSDEK